MNLKPEIIFLDCCESTNKTAKIYAKSGADSGTMIVADRQTDGRGRLSRSFFSPEGGIYLSLILRPEADPQSSLILTAAAAVAVCRAIEKNSDSKCLIKWVNDVYIDRKKVCGILCEGSLNPKTQTLDYIILGVGINLNEPKEGYPDEIKNIAGAVFGKNPPKNGLKEKIINDFYTEFTAFYEALPQKTFLQEYRLRSLLDGKTVSFIKDSKIYRAFVLGIDENAGLEVLYGDEKMTLTAGEVQLLKDENIK